MSEDVTSKRDLDTALLLRSALVDDDGPQCRVSGPVSGAADSSVTPASTWAACLVAIHRRSGERPGKCVEVRNPTTVGRGARCDIVLDESLVSRQHARFARESEGWRLTDLGSKNGTFRNSARVSDALLAHGDRIGIGTTVFKLLCEGDLTTSYREEIARMAVRDGLTQAWNKRRFVDLLDDQVLSDGRGGAVVALDVDHLDRINAENGFMVGNLALVEIARLTEPHLPEGHVLAHFGAGRFALFLPGASRDDAAALAEKLRREVSEHRFVHDDDDIHVTVSAGVAVIEPGDHSAHEVLTRVDGLLSRAKRGGRDRVAS